MKLSELMAALGGAINAIGRSDPEITAIHYRSQNVTPGSIFVAISGATADGHDYIDQAVAAGAAAIILESPRSLPVPAVQVTDSRRALAELAVAYFDRPAEAMTLIGITGTNGKTTTAFLIESMLKNAGIKVGIIGTVVCRYGDRQLDTPMTTPESLELQQTLREMADAGVTHVVMEVSSHALAQARVHGCRFAVGVFTNLTQDHLDFHGSMDLYWACKQRLFTDCLIETGATAVINRDDPWGDSLFDRLASAPTRRISTGRASDVRPATSNLSSAGIQARLLTPKGPVAIAAALVGQHNLENIMSAVGVGLALSIPLTDIADGINALPAVAGRLETVPDPDGRLVYVDYAHTPDALEHAIQTVRALTRQRVICIFGCGGDRDRSKRPIMGEIAGRLCDLVIITSDNPRTEDPEAIIAAVAEGAGCTGIQECTASDLADGITHRGCITCVDRREAIDTGIAAARPGDAVLIAGKGHETYQLMAGTTRTFDDRAEAARALADTVPAPPAIVTSVPDKAGWRLADICKATDGQCISGHPDHVFSGLAIDSRAIDPGGCFVAIQGDTHDGHDFIKTVLADGVRGVVVAANALPHLRPILAEYPDGACVAVTDTTAALGQLGAWHLRRLGTPTIAITGSSGKTTTRQMVAAVMKQRWRVLTPKRNFNNAIGLPLTLLRLTATHQWAVVELGMNQPGEIADLTALCTPHIGVITTVGEAHLEGVGTIEDVMAAKGELLGGLGSDRQAVLNADNPYTRRLGKSHTGPITWFGEAPESDCRAENVSLTADGSRFTLCLPDDRADVHLPVMGRFMITNALAAAAVAHHAGIPAESIARGLARFQPVNGRMARVDTPGGIHVINDSYNANPQSTTAALRMLSEMPLTGRRIAVLGEMHELGDAAADLHRQVGHTGARSGLAALFAVGDHAEDLASGARDGGMTADQIHTGSQKEIIEAVTAFARPGDWVLVKGSRAEAMEHVVTALTTDAANPLTDKDG